MSHERLTFNHIQKSRSSVKCRKHLPIDLRPSSKKRKPARRISCNVLGNF